MKEKSTLIILNLALLALTFWSFTLDYVSISEYSFSLTGLSRDLQYKDVQIKVFTSYSNFNAIACKLSQEEKIVEVCSRLSRLQLAGSLFLIISCLILILNLYCLYTSILLLPSTFYSLLSPLLYLAGSIMYFVLLRFTESVKKDEKLDFSYEIGCFSIITVNFVQGLLVARHFYFRNLRNESFFRLEDSKVSMNTGEILLDNRVQSEEMAEPSKVKEDEEALKKLKVKNTMLLEKLKFRGDINWETLNSLKSTLNSLLNSIEENCTQIDASVLLSMQENLKFFLDDLINKKAYEWDLKRKSYKNKIFALKSEINNSKFCKNNENQNMRNQIFTLQAERNELIQYQEKASTEIKRLQDLAERSVSMSNFQSTNSEIIRLNQEIIKFQKTLQEKTSKLIETEREIKELKISQEKYKNCLSCVGKIVKDEIVNTGSSGEFDLDSLNEQFFNYSESIKKSRTEVSLLESRVVELEAENFKLMNDLRNKEERYDDLKRLPEVVKDLKAKKKYLKKSFVE